MSAEVSEAGRLRKLEAEIKRLESENKKLLNKVHHPSQANGNTSLPLDLDDPEDGLLDLDDLLSDEILKIEEEWLYVSPRFPPTPEQKKVTPREWLSEGLYEGDVLSLDEVRRSLVKDIEAAEEIDEVHFDSYHKNSRNAKAAVRKQKEKASSPGKSSRNVPEVPRSSKGSSDDVPVVKWKRPVVVSDEESSGSVSEGLTSRQKDNVPATNGDVPIVKWKRPVLPSGENESMESAPSDPAEKNKRNGPAEDVPVVKWKRPVVPSDEESIPDEPVVRRKAKLPPSEESTQDVPVVKWKRPVVPSDEEPVPDEPVIRRKAKMPPSEESSQDVPVIKWKRPVVPSDDSLPDEPVVRKKAEDVPVVKWKRPIVPSDEESVESFPDEPVVRRKTRVSQHEESAEDVPVVKWKRPVVLPDEPDPDVPVVKWKRPVVPVDKQQEAESSVPVVKWKARGSPKSSPSGSNTSSQNTRNTSKLNPSSAAASDVPVVNWKARSPTDSSMRKSSSPESLDSHKSNTRRRTSPSPNESAGQRRLVKREGLKAPADSKRKTLSPENTDVSARKYKAKLPANSQEPQDKSSPKTGVPNRKGGLKVSPQRQYNGRAAQSASNNSIVQSSSPVADELQSTPTRKSKAKENPAASNSPSTAEVLRSSRSMQRGSNSSLSSESLSQEVSHKPSSRRSSFSDSRSPSPPSIAPHIRKAVGSPVMRRRTPSPARAAASRPSPNQNPALQQKQQLKLLTSQALSGTHLSPSMGAKVRSPHAGLVKGGTPVKGLIAPGDRKRRLLPASPDSASNSRLQGMRGRAAASHDSVSQEPPEQGKDGKEWLEGCF